MYKNYLKSLEQKYNAVCFDIDGTLTLKDSNNIDPRTISMITDLLKRKVPVVFITGRGEKGLECLKKDIYNQIKNSENITNEALKRIFVLTNDGARLFYSKEITFDSFLKENIYITTKEEIKNLSNVIGIIEELQANKNFKNFFDLKFSKDLKDGTIINLRMVFNTKNEKIINEIYSILKNQLSEEYKELFISRGMYKDLPVIQIGTSRKDKAIQKTEKLLGIPQDSMLRIGDCGDIKGNDFAMLNCNQGYSVDKINNDDNSCFPVFDEKGNILKGVDATLYLIKKAKLLPTICLEKADKAEYQYHFARVEKNIVLGRQKLLKKYNNLINLNFSDCFGIDDLFDRNSGCIKIPMYEIELLENSPLKDFWLIQKNNCQAYSMRDDNNYLLRGSSTYYYLLANRISSNGEDFTLKSDVINWYDNYLNFLDNSINAIAITKNVNYQINKKMILGILDNCRNVLLVLLNHNLISNHFNENVLLDISTENEESIYELYSTLYNVEKMISNICFQENFIVTDNMIQECLLNTKKIVLYNLKIELKKPEKQDYSKDYRTYREIDNFAENYIAVSLYEEKCNSVDIINACGLSYGGIELPVIAKIINANRIDKLLLLKFNKEVSGYSNKQLLDLRKFNINNYGGLLNSQDLSNTNVDIFDDNVLTGKTLQLSVNSLYDSNINVKNICIVRYPSINRLDQMFMGNTCAIDYNLFFNYIYGLCFNSPYSWKDNEWKKDNGKYDYTDSLGVFDLNRKKIIECLIKNHDFSECSEVGEYKRRLV